ncbi:LysR family transcriptional regulator [Amycolatopsis sp. NPDC059657]|uniref:LysR family transcriptional regulator n=1 Tax=Amycolatopsis sp. NPDC059657 TaxID=3346899 RepID=UPI00366D87D5
MELRQLRYFVTVAEELHFGRAAERLHIVQPAVSQQVRRLERELGSDLFDRTTRSVTLTTLGHRFLPHAKEVLASEARALAAIKELREEREHTIRLGTSDGIGDRMDRLLAAFTARVPGAHLDLVHAPVEQRLRDVRSGKLDATIVRGTWDVPELDFTPLWDDPVVVALPAAHPLAAQDSVAFAELAELPARLSSRKRNPPLFDLIVRCCREAGFEPLLGKEFTTAQDTLATLAFGPHWTVFYAAHANLLPVPGVTFRPLRDPEPIMPTYLAIRADRRLGPELLALIAAGQGL